MTDYFALLQETRRPWIDPEALKQKFLQLSQRLHPDRVHANDAGQKSHAQKDFLELNTAYQTLLNPRERLRHLLWLETGSKPPDIQNVPEELMSFFLEVSSACREADAVLSGKGASQSALLQVEFFERAQEERHKLLTLQRKVTDWTSHLDGELRRVDEQWTNAATPGPDLLEAAQVLVQLYACAQRWGAQVQERITQLSI